MNYKNKKVLILGLGLNEGGVGSARFFARNDAEVLVTDLKDGTALKPSLERLKDFPDIKYHLGGHKKEDIDWADLIIRNPGVKPDNPFLIYAISKGKKIKTDVEIFLESADLKNIIGITGTKGKSTTSSLIYEVLKASGKKVLLAGNIGRSVFNSIDQIQNDTLVVLEISSFQLESFDASKVSPKYAVITNIYPDHLNYYSSMDEYIDAKKLIAKHQSEDDFLFINKGDEIINNKNFLNGIKSQIIFFAPSDLPKDFKGQILGQGNLFNLAAAFAVSKVLEIPRDSALKALENFKGIPFRLQLIKEWNGVKIYNNTTATAPEPAIESLKTLAFNPRGCKLILIAGGMNKGLRYKEFALAIDKYANSVYLLDGDASAEINCELDILKSPKAPHDYYSSLEDILEDVKEEAKPGDIILFSPGATSFNLFQNEFDRGRKFNEAVEKVFS